MNWLHYLLEANLYLAIFYIGYYLLFSRETHYNLNRAYLLFGCVAAFVLPFLQLGILKPVQIAAPVASNITFIPQRTYINATPTAVTPVVQHFNWQNDIIYVYLAGAAVLLLVLLIKLVQLVRLTRVTNIGSDGKYKVVYIDESNTAFSFFGYLFIGTKVQESDTIIKHELVHIRQKHSADIIFIELLKIVNWFNPFIYLTQYSLRAIHEYIADEKTATANGDTHSYSSFLVSNAYGLSGSSITHSFFNYNLLKKRIIMLHQKRSGSLARLKYLLAVPICGGVLCASTLAFSKTYGWDIAPHRINKANTSKQVNEPGKRMLVKKDGVVTLTDKFSDKRADGITREYTAYNLSNKDKVELAKKGIIVNVISDVKIDTNDHRLPPPPPEPPVQVKFPAPKNPTGLTAKGYRYAEGGSMVNGKVVMNVLIYQKDGPYKEYVKSKLSDGDIALLKDKYGYTFPEKPNYKNLPPPPPPAPPVKTAYTKKGYKYEETGYLVHEETNFRVIITEKNGDQKAYFRNTASVADVKLLGDKYGYTFPSMKIFSKLPPPPPEPPGPPAHAIDKRPPPPPPAPPKGVKFPPPVVIHDQVKFPPPVVRRDQVKLPKGHKFPPPVVVPDSPKQAPPPPPAPPVKDASNNQTPPSFVAKGVVYKIKDQKSINKNPVLVVNGKVQEFKVPLKKGQELIVDAADSVHAMMYTDKDLQQAVLKYGNNAKNGVIFAYGKTSVTVK